MTIERQLRFWLIGLAFFVLALVLLRAVLLPFVLGMAIAYLLDPLCDWLEDHKFPRWLATSVLLVLFTLFCLTAVMLLVPVLTSQASELLKRAPAYISSVKAHADHLLETLEARTDPAVMDRIQASFGGISEKAITWLTKALSNLLTQGAAIANLISLVVITPVVAFYLLRDWDKMLASIAGWLPRRHVRVIRSLAGEVDRTLAGFVRGQSMVCLSLGCFYAIGLTLAGLDFGLIIGLMAGFLTFIPYAGSIFGMLLSVGLAALQFDSLTRVGIVAAIFLVGQAIEGNVLTPKLVGDRVGLHPVWVIFALLAGGALFGFVGILIAVPLAAVVGVAVRFGLDLYLESPFYDDQTAGPEAEELPGRGRPEQQTSDEGS
ncbi:MAG TPA: AI-2E family transporter [Kiloniellaceae bacterium]|nr:AI-2E family transporter [Kiloniellaceae bacterium]